MYIWQLIFLLHATHACVKPTVNCAPNTCFYKGYRVEEGSFEVGRYNIGRLEECWERCFFVTSDLVAVTTTFETVALLIKV